MNRSTSPASSMDLVLKTLRAVALAALDENVGDTSLPKDRNFWSLAGRAPMSKEDLQQLPKSGIRSAAGRCVRLPSRQIDNATWMPLLWIHEHPKADHQIQIVVTGQGRPFGYRWEPPEGGPTGVGDHDYWHVQPIRGVRLPGTADVALGVPSGDVCTVMPSFPIDAEGQLDMLDALFVSIYGPHYLNKYVNDVWLRNEVQKATSARSWARLRKVGATPTYSVQRRKKRGKRKRKK